MLPNIIDSREDLVQFLVSLTDLRRVPPALYLDLEGEDLSRHGTLSIMQIHVEPTGLTYLVDVQTLGNDAFTIKGPDGKSLKSILESSRIPKVFFDVRNDSDALYGHYQISLAGVHDLQLMELATRTFSRRCVNGLSKCIENDSTMSFQEKRQWNLNKTRGKALFDPKQGGSYAVFNERPLSKDVKIYCAQDVSFLPDLWKTYYTKLNHQLWRVVLNAGKERVIESQSILYDGKGPHKALGPWNRKDQTSWRRFNQTRLVIKDTMCENGASEKGKISGGPSRNWNGSSEDVTHRFENLNLDFSH